MDRIERALERSRSERDRGSRAPADSVGPGARALKRIPSSTAVDPPAPLAAAGVEQESVRTRRVHVDPAAVRESGLLPANLAGVAGHGTKMLRAMIMQRMKQRGWNTLAVVSPGANEGKTFVAANLAIAIAADPNHTALLVDLDLKQPRVHSRFGVTPQAGVEECLAGRQPLSAALLGLEEYPGLVLLPCHAPVTQSSELIGSQRAVSLFRELKERYVNRFVIYDLPPMLAGDDAVVFAAHADAVLVVVGDNRTRRVELTRCLELLQHVPVLGTVLNGSTGKAGAPPPSR